MQKIDFKDAVDLVLASDSRYAGDAYYFLQEVLTQAVDKHYKETGRRRPSCRRGGIVGGIPCPGQEKIRANGYISI